MAWNLSEKEKPAFRGACGAGVLGLPRESPAVKGLFYVTQHGEDDRRCSSVPSFLQVALLSAAARRLTPSAVTLGPPPGLRAWVIHPEP